MAEVAAIDIGGTHVRFAVAQVEDNRVLSLSEPAVYEVACYEGLEQAWSAFAKSFGRALPKVLGIAAAGRTDGGVIRFTNNPWTVDLASLPERLGVERYRLVNDFGAVAHAVARLSPQHFAHLAGPDEILPVEGPITIVGPGTGLGVAQLQRRDGEYHVVETEGGHSGFAPLDEFEDQLLVRLRKRYGRVSTERLASGSGFPAIYEALAEINGEKADYPDARALWEAALHSEDALAGAALERFCMILGAVAGDLALAQGAQAVVIAGGLGRRLVGHLPKSGFHERFVAKGRFGKMMEGIPVKAVTYPEPGLFGATAAFTQAEA